MFRVAYATLFRLDRSGWMPEAEPDAGTVRLIQSEIVTALDRQFEANAQLNQRVHQILGFAGIVLGVFVALHPPDAAQVDISILAGIGLALFLVIAITGGCAWTLRDFRRDPPLLDAVDPLPARARAVASRTADPQPR